MGRGGSVITFVEDNLGGLKMEVELGSLYFALSVLVWVIIVKLLF
jgi:hypothetical protein